MTILEKALRLSALAHKNQTRKGTPVPYIIHPVMVAHLLQKYGASDTVIAAALVHDVLEDTPITLDELRSELGEDIAHIVELLSEDKSLPWKERKNAYKENVRTGGEDVQVVSLGDKVHNLASLLDEYEERGEELWSVFNASKEDKLWFEEEMLKVFSDLPHPLVEEYRALVGRLRALV